MATAAPLQTRDRGRAWQLLLLPLALRGDYPFGFARNDVAGDPVAPLGILGSHIYTDYPEGPEAPAHFVLPSSRYGKVGPQIQNRISQL